MAPEIIEGKKYSPGKADVFSLGVLLFTMVACMHPFKEMASKDDERYKYLLESKLDEFWEPALEKLCLKEKLLSDEFRDLVEKCLINDPNL